MKVIGPHTHTLDCELFPRVLGDGRLKEDT